MRTCYVYSVVSPWLPKACIGCNFRKTIPLNLVCMQKNVDGNVSPIPDLHECFKTDEGLEGGTAEQLSTNLARASPEVRKCVASCKHIAETARQQNNFQNVRSVFFFHVFMADLLWSKSTSLVTSRFY